MTGPVVQNSETTCTRCGRRIVLKMNTPTSENAKYVLASDPQHSHWKCQTSPERPVQAHVPARYVDEKENH